MTRRKREIVGLTNEQDFPHLVELAVPQGGFRGAFLEFDAFHQERRIPVRRGRSRHKAEQFYIRFCFADTAIADAFRNRFGGECLLPPGTFIDASRILSRSSSCGSRPFDNAESEQLKSSPRSFSMPTGARRPNLRSATQCPRSSSTESSPQPAA